MIIRRNAITATKNSTDLVVNKGLSKEPSTVFTKNLSFYYHLVVFVCFTNHPFNTLLVLT